MKTILLLLSLVICGAAFALTKITATTARTTYLNAQTLQSGPPAAGGGGGSVGLLLAWSTNAVTVANSGVTLDGGSGANRGLLVFIGGYTGGFATNVAWGGTALTEIARTNYYDGSPMAQAFYLHNPVTGSQTLSNKFSASIDNHNFILMFVTNAHQTVAIGGKTIVETDSDIPGQTNSVSCAANSLIADMWVNFATPFAGVRVAGQTRATTGGGVNTKAESSWIVATGSSQSMGWTNSVVDRITHVIIEIKPP